MENMMNSIEVRYANALLDALELRTDVSKWRNILNSSMFKQGNEMRIPITLYCDIMNYIKWEMWKVNKEYGDVRGVSGKMDTGSL